MATVKEIRGLQRGVQVIRALQGTHGASLAQLHVDTGLPKATLLRVLRTLESERLVWRSLGDGLYRFRAAAFASAWVRNQRLAEAAGPHLVALQREALWPSDLVVRNGTSMEVVESTRALARLAISRDDLGDRVDIATTAAGRAYLAFCPQAERERIMRSLERQADMRGVLGPVDVGELEAALAVARSRGYALRGPRLGLPLRPSSTVDDGLDAIAVPVRTGQRVLGALNLVWFRRFELREKMVRTHLPRLVATAAAIGQAYASGARAPVTDPASPAARTTSRRPPPGAVPSRARSAP